MVKVDDILTDDTVEMSFIQNKDMIQTFASHTADEALTDRIGFGCSHWGPADLNPPIVTHTRETWPILAVIIADQKTRFLLSGVASLTC